MILKWLTGVGGWVGAGLGFALQAAGVPVPSVLLFPALAALAKHAGVPWWISGGVAGVSIAFGHLLSYVVFTSLGQPLLARLTERIPALRRLTQRVGYLLAQGRSWLPLLGLRWLGTGYSQVFWLLGAMRMLPAMLLGLLFLNDLVWALVWTYAWMALTGRL